MKNVLTDPSEYTRSMVNCTWSLHASLIKGFHKSYRKTSCWLHTYRLRSPTLIIHKLHQDGSHPSQKIGCRCIQIPLWWRCKPTFNENLAPSYNIRSLSPYCHLCFAVVTCWPKFVFRSWWLNFWCSIYVSGALIVVLVSFSVPVGHIWTGNIGTMLIALAYDGNCITIYVRSDEVENRPSSSLFLSIITKKMVGGEGEIVSISNR